MPGRGKSALLTREVLFVGRQEAILKRHLERLGMLERQLSWQVWT